MVNIMFWNVVVVSDCVFIVYRDDFHILFEEYFWDLNYIFQLYKYFNIS